MKQKPVLAELARVEAAMEGEESPQVQAGDGRGRASASPHLFSPAQPPSARLSRATAEALALAPSRVLAAAGGQVYSSSSPSASPLWTPRPTAGLQLVTEAAAALRKAEGAEAARARADQRARAAQSAASEAVSLGEALSRALSSARAEGASLKRRLEQQQAARLEDHTGLKAALEQCTRERDAALVRETAARGALQAQQAAGELALRGAAQVAAAARTEEAALAGERAQEAASRAARAQAGADTWRHAAEEERRRADRLQRANEALLALNARLLARLLKPGGAGELRGRERERLDAAPVQLRRLTRAQRAAAEDGAAALEEEMLRMLVGGVHLPPPPMPAPHVAAEPSAALGGACWESTVAQLEERARALCAQ